MKKYVLAGLGLLFMIASVYLVFVYVPTEREMGIVQRIFYLMVPMGWLALLSFFIVFICSILYLAKRQDPKGLYAKALRGEIQNFTGISSPYEAPQQPQLVVETDIESIDLIVDKIVKMLESEGIINQG